MVAHVSKVSKDLADCSMWSCTFAFGHMARQKPSGAVSYCNIRYPFMPKGILGEELISAHMSVYCIQLVLHYLEPTSSRMLMIPHSSCKAAPTRRMEKVCA